MKHLIAMLLTAIMLVQTTTNATIWKWCAKTFGTKKPTRIEKVAPDGTVLTQQEQAEQEHTKKTARATDIAAKQAAGKAQERTDLLTEIALVQASIQELDKHAKGPLSTELHQFRIQLTNNLVWLQTITPATFSNAKKQAISRTSYRDNSLRLIRTILFPICLSHVCTTICNVVANQKSLPMCYESACKFTMLISAAWIGFVYMPLFCNRRDDASVAPYQE